MSQFLKSAGPGSGGLAGKFGTLRFASLALVPRRGLTPLVHRRLWWHPTYDTEKDRQQTLAQGKSSTKKKCKKKKKPKARNDPPTAPWDPGFITSAWPSWAPAVSLLDEPVGPCQQWTEHS